ncbi:MerR family transcriptional regulator [Lewinella sp. IMCC34183]|uniref:MerR family transcriptional regulator n=1 Tax=Lewinella sp. IMCC34183 TaxID=2248762 RepID=UPI000E24C2D4|nr:MerR family transcriptional regulator [Lewinella sp. IMCC34183]
MVVYTISDVEKLTGIRAHTLRAWEQRYDLVTPRRDENNVRYYLEPDLKELCNIALLNRHGYRISKIAALSDRERRRAVASVSSLNISADTELDALTLCAVEPDPERFSFIIDTNVAQRGFEETMMEVVYPMLDKLGLLYFTGSVRSVQESLISALIRQKLLAATDQLPFAGPGGLPRFALFLPEGERQELSTLFVQYLLRKRGFPVLYLGADVSPQDLEDLVRVTEVDYLFAILSSTFVARPVEELAAEILERCPDSRLLLSGYQATLHDLSEYPRATCLGGLTETIRFVESLSNRASQNIAAVK